ncbi:hypothetical protein SEUCBS139899_007367 [Sporothrix eucalyptigena]
MDILRDILQGAAYRAHAAVQWTLGGDRTAQVARWFKTAYNEQPLLFGLVVTWMAFCAVPLAVFIGYATVWAVIAFSVFWAIFLFWSGLGLLFLVPALFVATGFSLVVFSWAAATYFVGVRLLSAAGYEGTFLFGGEETTKPSADNTKSNDMNGTNSTNNGNKLDKPPSYALHPLPPVNKLLDVKTMADFGTPPLASPGEVPISTK